MGIYQENTASALWIKPSRVNSFSGFRRLGLPAMPRAQTGQARQAGVNLL